MEKVFQSVEEVVADEAFQSWYLKTESAKSTEWEQWMQKNPAQSPLVQEAIMCMQHILIKEQEFPSSRIESAHDRLMDKLPKSGKARVVPISPSRKWWWAAAVILLVITGTYLVYDPRKNESFQTSFGQVRVQKLPDGSEVTLNANSTISYHTGWEKGEEREVWIKGEAFFNVMKTQNKSRFIVHMNQFDVVVTGTQFNVVNRDDNTNVMLTEGSVILRTAAGKEFPMQPGDYVEFNGSQFLKAVAKEEAVLAWKDRKIMFDNTPLKEVVRKIREHYGVEIELEDPSMADKTIGGGFFPNDNLDVLLKMIEATDELKVIRKDDRILITHP